MTARLDVTAALIVRQGKILVARRPYGTRHAGWWEFPGGKQESGETLEACLAREIQEELSLTIDVVRPYARVEHDDGEIALTLHAFLCRPVDLDVGAHPAGQPMGGAGGSRHGRTAPPGPRHCRKKS